MNTDRMATKTATGTVPECDRVERKLYQRALLSVLRDYTDTSAETLSELLFQANAAGFRVHDLTHEGNLKQKGILVSRQEKGGFTAIAFIEQTRRLETEGMTLRIHRLDKVCIESLELRSATA